MLFLLLIGVLAVEASPNDASPSKADQVIVVKSQRTRRILRTYKVSPGDAPVGAKQQEGDHKTRKAVTSSIAAIPTAGSTNQFTSPIPVNTTNKTPPTSESPRAATS